MENIGARAVSGIHTALQIDQEWTVHHEDGFTWWPYTLAQRICWSGPFDREGASLWRVQTMTDVATGFVDNDENWMAVTVASRFAMMSAVVREPGDASLLRLVMTAYVHEDTVDYLQDVLNVAVALQAVEAHRLAAGIAQDGLGVIAASEHPQSGARSEHDDMLAVVETTIAPEGQQPSRWARDVGDAAELLRNLAQVSEEPGSLQAEFAAGDVAALVSISTDQEHPLLGSGVLILGRLDAGSGLDPRLPIVLNGLSSSGQQLIPSWGSWCLDDEGSLAHVAFFPNALYRPGLLRSLAVDGLNQLGAGAGMMKKMVEGVGH